MKDGLKKIMIEYQQENSKILWELSEQGGARILRVYGNAPSVSIPAIIAGYPVTELDNYCFANNCHLPSQYLQIKQAEKENQNLTSITELCGSYIDSVILPDTIRRIGDYAFYGCRNMFRLEFGRRLCEIGSDAFMNCHNLCQLAIKSDATAKTGLRQILRQISWDVEVSFLDSEGLHAKTVIFYPEYDEVYDEIAPAHIFSRKIIGEGFRARQAFQDNAIDFAQYDLIFEKACAQEPTQTLCRLAFYRLRYPIGLTSYKKEQYTQYIYAHGKALCRRFVEERQLDGLNFLFCEKLLSMQDTQYAILLAAQNGWSEGNASMLVWKQRYYRFGEMKYEFEDF